MELVRVQSVMEKFEADTGTELKCITEHPGFTSICLDIYVLQMAYVRYKRQWGHLEGDNTNE